MPFQTTVNLTQGFGVVGELFTDSPVRAKSYILNSATNTIGHAFTVSSEGIAVQGGTGVFAGILVNPKTYALKGTTSGTLTPTLVLPQYTQGELLTMGEIIVNLATAANIGDQVQYDTTTGELSAISQLASFTAAISGTTMTVSAVAQGTVSVGQTLSGANVKAGTVIVSLGTGTGGTGTYEVSDTQTAASATVTAVNYPVTGYAVVPKAVVSRYTLSAAGLATIELTN